MGQDRGKPAAPDDEGFRPLTKVYENAHSFRHWLTQIEARVTDLAAVAEDQIAPPAARQLGRAKARELIDDAMQAIEGLIAFARVDLPPEPGEDGAPPVH